MLGAETISVFRDNDVQVTIKGVPASDTRQEFQIRASVQPVAPDEIVEEGVGADRGRGTIKVYTQFRLIPLDEEAKKRGDQIGYKGKLYEVRSVLPYEMKSRLAHYKAVAVLIDSELP